MKLTNKLNLYSGLVWIVSGLALLVYGFLGYFKQTLPGVEELVGYLSTIGSDYLFLGAFVAVIIEGLYVVGNLFPGATLVIILSLLSQSGGYFLFGITMLSIFIGWSVAGLLNIFFAKLSRNKFIKLPEENEYKIKDRVLTTWFPSFRANYEVQQIIEGGDWGKVFISSLRVKFLATLVLSVVSLVLFLVIDVSELTNEEGFLSVLVIALISIFVGYHRLKDK